MKILGSVNELFSQLIINLKKDQTNVCNTCRCGDRLKAERVLLWLVHNSFQIH